MKNEQKVFESICDYICRNYSELKKEFEEVNNLLIVAENFGAAYRNRDFMEAHFKHVVKKQRLPIIEALISLLSKIKKSAVKEFFQEVELINLYDNVINKMRNEGIVVFVWETKEKIQYVMYGIKRINEADTMEKKIAILKGMVAY